MKARTRVKICGITRIEDAVYAAQSGADSLGLNFHPESPRCLEIEQAIRIRESILPFVNVTALFMDEDDDWIAQVIHQVRPDCLQFHGSESVDFCESWNTPYLKTIPMGSVDDPLSYAKKYPSAQGFLLDSHAAGIQGGSGNTFDWSRFPSDTDFPLILAGGITAENATQAIQQTRPWGVDVSSGVELEKGIKSPELIDAFIKAVIQGDSAAR
ncbi:MAG: phosphoribosylanthranilate isomerase [Pseudomonadota bacterium]